MLLFFTLPILAAGFLVQFLHPYHYFRLHRSQGQLLYLKSLLFGLACFAIAFALCCYLDTLPASIGGLSINVKSLITEVIARLNIVQERQLMQIVWFILLSTATILVALCWCGYGHLLIFVMGAKEGFAQAGKLGRISQAISLAYIKGRRFLLFELLADSPLDREMFMTMISLKPILISLSNRKVYVGIICSMAEPTECKGTDQEVTIIPLRSGYRGDSELAVTFLIDYVSLRKQGLGDGRTITFRQALIESICQYDHELHCKACEQCQKDKPKWHIKFKPDPETYTWEISS